MNVTGRPTRLYCTRTVQVRLRVRHEGKGKGLTLPRTEPSNLLDLCTLSAATHATFAMLGFCRRSSNIRGIVVQSRRTSADRLAWLIVWQGEPPSTPVTEPPSSSGDNVVQMFSRLVLDRSYDSAAALKKLSYHA